MQTFLVYPSFPESAKHLDNKRLNKQFLEARQILKTLISGGGWANHPAIKMWKNHEGSLLNYCAAISLECDNRKFKITLGTVQLYKIVEGKIHCLNYSVPEWLGNEKFHSSHRSRLLCKGEGDRVCDGLKSILKIRKIDNWLKICIKKTKNQLKWLDIINLKNYYYSVTKTSLKTNFYTKYGWLDDPSKEYIWPENS